MAQETGGTSTETSPSTRYRSELDDFEKDDGRPPFFLTMAEVKLLSIAGVRLQPYIFEPQTSDVHNLMAGRVLFRR